MKLLMFAASVRQDSCNKKLIRLSAELAKQMGAEIDLTAFAEFLLPNYDGDTEAAQGLPENGLKFIERLKNVDALVISSPEYNFSMPGTLKNLVDWISRYKPMPWQGKQILLMSASPALVGGNRGLWSLRVPLEACGAFVYPDMFSLASAYEAFTETGELKDAVLQKRLQENLQKFLNHISKF